MSKETYESHTLGEWVVVKLHDGTLAVQTSDGHTGICTMAEDDDGGYMPDARLIASAPELLAACREALTDYTGCNVERFTRHETDKMNRLRAAIAKAEGE